MQSLSDNERREVLGEVLSDQLKAILEYVQEIPAIKRRLDNLETKVDSIDSRMSILEAIAKDHESELRIIKNHPALT